MADEFCLKMPDFHVTCRDFICRKSTTWNKRLYFPSEGRRAEDFFALKNPTASARFEPANLGTKGQHATSRPPKPLYVQDGQTYHTLWQRLQTSRGPRWKTAYRWQLHYVLWVSGIRILPNVLWVLYIFSVCHFHTSLECHFYACLRVPTAR